MVLNLLKTTASLTRDHQRLQSDFVDHAQEIDGRMSSTENVTNQITTTLANTVKTFASLQSSVTDFQVQINATTETQISDRCDQAVTKSLNKRSRNIVTVVNLKYSLFLAESRKKRREERKKLSLVSFHLFVTS